MCLFLFYIKMERHPGIYSTVRLNTQVQGPALDCPGVALFSELITVAMLLLLIIQNQHSRKYDGLQRSEVQINFQKILLDSKAIVSRHTDTMITQASFLLD